jgi:hypothetical protein
MSKKPTKQEGKPSPPQQPPVKKQRASSAQAPPEQQVEEVLPAEWPPIDNIPKIFPRSEKAFLARVKVPGGLGALYFSRTMYRLSCLLDPQYSSDQTYTGESVAGGCYVLKSKKKLTVVDHYDSYQVYRCFCYLYWLQDKYPKTWEEIKAVSGEMAIPPLMWREVVEMKLPEVMHTCNTKAGGTGKSSCCARAHTTNREPLVPGEVRTLQEIDKHFQFFLHYSNADPATNQEIQAAAAIAFGPGGILHKAQALHQARFKPAGSEKGLSTAYEGTSADP